MKTVVPDYYKVFRCSAGACGHTCCIGWEVGIDEESLERFLAMPDIAPYIENTDDAHIRLDENERCPFLNRSGLCEMIINHGEEVLCGICRDHPRFRSFWSDRIEIGLGLVCEEAARLILGRSKPMTLITISDDGKEEAVPEDEAWLTELRREMLDGIKLDGMHARLLEYLIYRHMPDALYDGRVEERTEFIRSAYDEIVSMWDKSDGAFETAVQIARQWSYDTEYDDEVLEARIAAFENIGNGEFL